MYADIFITAVMTGPPGQHGMSVLLVHKDTPGFSVRKINIRGADLSGLLFCFLVANAFVILYAEFSC